MQKIRELGDGLAGIAAGVDAAKGGEVHGHIEAESVEAAAVAYAQPDSGDLGALHVDAGGIRAGGCFDAVRCQ